MEQTSTIGVDIAKHVFQVHRADQLGGEGHRLVGGTTAMRRCDESVCRRALLGTRDKQAGPLRAVDRASLRQAVRQATEERRGRRGGHL